jgi:hypothetical protein
MTFCLAQDGQRNNLGRKTMLETVAWAVCFMGLGALIVVLVGLAVIHISKEDI